MSLIRDLDHEQRLVHILKDLAVNIFKISGQVNLFAVVDEGVLQRTCLKVNILHEVASIVAPVSDDWLAAKLKLSNLLSLMLAVALLLNLKQTIQTSLG